MKVELQDIRLFKQLHFMANEWNQKGMDKTRLKLSINININTTHKINYNSVNCSFVDNKLPKY
jgi:hypothetical protein